MRTFGCAALSCALLLPVTFRDQRLDSFIVCADSTSDSDGDRFSRREPARQGVSTRRSKGVGNLLEVPLKERAAHQSDRFVIFDVRSAWVCCIRALDPLGRIAGHIKDTVGAT